MKDPNEFLLPSHDLVLIALRKNESGDYIPFTLLDNLPPHLSYGSIFGTPVSRSLGAHISGLAHVVKSPIASRTEWFSSSDCFPFNLR
jgi:hypothetical protein